MEWILKKIKIEKLKEFPKNPRSFTEQGLKDLKESIQKFGLAEPLVVNKDYIICGGHGRLKILTELGIKEVDCYMPIKELTDKEFEELNIRLNKNIAGVWDFDVLANEFDLIEIKEFGFSDRELGLDIQKINEMEEWNKEDMPEFKFEKEIILTCYFKNKEQREKWCKRHDIEPTTKREGQWTIRV